MKYVRSFVLGPSERPTVKMPAVRQAKLVEECRLPVSERPTVKIRAVVLEHVVSACRQEDDGIDVDLKGIFDEAV